MYNLGYFNFWAKSGGFCKWEFCTALIISGLETDCGGNY